MWKSKRNGRYFHLNAMKFIAAGTGFEMCDCMLDFLKQTRSFICSGTISLSTSYYSFYLISIEK